jgi:hypothetical protein
MRKVGVAIIAAQFGVVAVLGFRGTNAPRKGRTWAQSLHAVVLTNSLGPAQTAPQGPVAKCSGSPRNRYMPENVLSQLEKRSSMS